jgi:molybdopterin converting factor small subunit
MSDHEFEDMFLEEEKNKAPKSKVDLIVQNIEDEYVGVKKETPEQKSREEDKSEIKAKIAELTKKLKTFKNARNVHRAAVNQKMHELREKIRKQIKEFEDKLAVIDQEEMGSKIDPVSVIKSEKEKKLAEMSSGKISNWSDLIS